MVKLTETEAEELVENSTRRGPRPVKTIEQATIDCAERVLAQLNNARELLLEIVERAKTDGWDFNTIKLLWDDIDNTSNQLVERSEGLLRCTKK